MSRLIDADELSKYMYHEAFETDTYMQKWDSGCWIRYKMFENAIDNAQTVDAVEVVRCKDCKYSSFVSHCSKYECGRLEDVLFFSDDYCSYGERKESEETDNA